eukprot:7941056-Pyramimonas_sp.AAC.1
MVRTIPGSWLYKSPCHQYSCAAKVAKKAVRSHKRQLTAELVTQAEVADRHQDTRQSYAIIRRLAPKPTLPTMTVFNPETGTVCFDHEDMAVRAKALCSIFCADEVTPPLVPTSPLTDLDDPSTEITESSTARAIMKLPNFKAAPTLKWCDPNSTDH